MGNDTNEQDFLNRIDREFKKQSYKGWSKHSWQCLRNYFKDEKDFNNFVCSLDFQNNRGKFLWLSAFWNVMGDQYEGAHPQTIKLIVSFSVIESLFNEEYQDFLNWLSSEKLKKELEKNENKVEISLENLKEEWRQKYGSSEKFRRFFRDYVEDKDKNTFLQSFEIRRGDEKEFQKIQSIDEFSGFLIKLRNKFIHEARVIDVFLNQKSEASLAMGRVSKNYYFNSPVRFEIIEKILKKGFKKYFESHVKEKS